MLPLPEELHVLTEAIADVVDGTRAREIWGRLGWIDIQRRYRRTAFGPFWTTLSVGMFIFPLGFLWARLWGVPLEEFLPHLTCGMIAWSLISTMIVEGCVTFSAQKDLILSVRTPLTTLAYAVVWRNMIVMFHNLILVFVVVQFFGKGLDAKALMFFPAMVLLFLNGLWIAILLGGLCCRFRDIQQVVVSLMSVFMFCTPVLWNADRLGPDERFYLNFNMFFHFVEIFRAPFLQSYPTTANWLIIIGWTVVGWIAALLFIGRFRNRIPYWL